MYDKDNRIDRKIENIPAVPLGMWIKCAVYGARRSPFRFRTAAFRSKTAVHFS